MTYSHPILDLPLDEAISYSPSFAKTAPRPTAPPAPPPPRQNRFIGFAADPDSATLLREVFTAAGLEDHFVHLIDFKASLANLAAMPTPGIVLVDLTGEDQPINAVMSLAEAVDAGTTVLAIGESQNVSFYRTLTKGLGIREYLPKPLTRESVEKYFMPHLGQAAALAQHQRGGRMVTVAGVRGGVGTTTLCSNLAWMIGSEMHRHTVLLDADLHSGTAALNFNLECVNGLAAALEMPDRVDSLLIERSIQTADNRLHVLAAQENLDRPTHYREGSGGLLTQTLRARYNFVIADAGARLQPFARDLLGIAQTRVIVMDPSMIAFRNLERLMTLPSIAPVPPNTLLVLNKGGTPGGLSRNYMEKAMGLNFAAVIPDLPRIVPKCTQIGMPAAALKGPYRSAIGELAKILGAAALPPGA